MRERFLIGKQIPGELLISGRHVARFDAQFLQHQVPRQRNGDRLVEGQVAIVSPTADAAVRRGDSDHGPGRLAGGATRVRHQVIRRLDPGRGIADVPRDRRHSGVVRTRDRIWRSGRAPAVQVGAHQGRTPDSHLHPPGLFAGERAVPAAADLRWHNLRQPLRSGGHARQSDLVRPNPAGRGLLSHQSGHARVRSWQHAESGLCRRHGERAAALAAWPVLHHHGRERRHHRWLQRRRLWRGAHRVSAPGGVRQRAGAVRRLRQY